MTNIKALKNDEICQVFGGWACSSTYEGKPFYKAEWRDCVPNLSKSSGACYYGTNRKDLVPYRVPNNIVGIIQKPVNHWSNEGKLAIFDIWTCYEKNPNNCVFEER